MNVAFLLVTCCLEQSRAEVLAQVLKNLADEAPGLRDIMTVFDNASTIPGTVEALRSCYTHVYQADRNVGYWSAIDWWLDQLAADPPTYTYIIESDNIHYGFNRLQRCAAYLDNHPDVGGVRTHEYIVAEQHLYDKDHPQPNSRRQAWRSHTNQVTGERVTLTQDEDDIYVTNFPAHVPALNRYPMMQHAFKSLRAITSGFTEHDFQRVCHEFHQKFALIDGGLFRELAFNGSANVGSFLPPHVLKKMGYQTVRTATITPQNEYTANRL